MNKIVSDDLKRNIEAIADPEGKELSKAMTPVSSPGNRDNDQQTSAPSSSEYSARSQRLCRQGGRDMILREIVGGVVEFNDGQFAEVQTFGVQGVEQDLLLSTMQIHREDAAETPEQFEKRLPVGMLLHITTTTEINCRERDRVR